MWFAVVTIAMGSTYVVYCWCLHCTLLYRCISWVAVCLLCIFKYFYLEIHRAMLLHRYLIVAAKIDLLYPLYQSRCWLVC